MSKHAELLLPASCPLAVDLHYHDCESFSLFKERGEEERRDNSRTLSMPDNNNNNNDDDNNNKR